LEVPFFLGDASADVVRDIVWKVVSRPTTEGATSLLAITSHSASASKMTPSRVAVGPDGNPFTS
jgi:hypothetical protein